MINKISLPAAAAALIVGLSGVAGASVQHQPAAQRPVAAAADNLTPGLHHRRLDPLIGEWKVVKTNYFLGGGVPVVSRDITVKVRWISKTGGRFLEERAEGTLAGNRYYRVGILGFSNIDRRYEWTTFDNATPTAMTYRGAPVTGAPSILSIPGAFTDPGLLGPEYLGKSIPMRTVITIAPNGRHTFDLYFTPPGQAERLADRVVYTRKIR
ncbi:DUF1579 family protein [Actinomadura rudentiformis]|uniref:DUF1579 family protein n=1 Tax=Actinomadura rudentiformis TaxID=359158 RepID=UPI00178C175B|nr:DUF1579 family protein [Actinomadura rudentiformis]